jgi:hypothetical protein
VSIDRPVTRDGHPTIAPVDVSVIVAVRNGARTLDQCLRSVTAQQDCRVELIVVDALSDDGSCTIVKSFGPAVAVYIREPDGGIYDAWNKALRVSNGEWCAFLGADDFFVSASSLSSLIRCAQASERRPSFVYGGLVRRGAIEDYLTHPSPRDAYRHLRRGRMLPHPGSLHHVGDLREVGGFDPDLRIAGDLDALLRLASRGDVTRCDAVITVVRSGGISSDRSTQGLLQAERFKILRRERGAPFAAWNVLTGRLLQLLDWGIQAMLTRTLGSTRGGAVRLRIRRALGRRPSWP